MRHVDCNFVLTFLASSLFGRILALILVVFLFRRAFENTTAACEQVGTALAM